MVKRNGYNIETYEVPTQDGYILTLFYIFGKNKPSKPNPVYMQHGIIVNTGHYVDLGSRSCAFYFVDKGYQVWLGNVRGSAYSRKHKNLTTRDPQFWTYNLDSIVEYDLPALISFVYNKSGHKVHYGGDSFGTTVGVMLAASNKEVSSMLQSVVLLGPAVYIHNLQPLKYFYRPALIMTDMLILFGVRGLLYQKYLPILAVYYCKMLPELCLEFIKVTTGSIKLFPPENLPLFFSYWPDGLSIFELKHYLQLGISNKLQKFDHGGHTNLKKYGTRDPPLYNLSAISVPVCIFYGESDQLYDKEDLERTYNEIGSSQKCKYAVSNDKNVSYGHLDFGYSESVTKDLYDVVLDVLEKFEA
ncbi:lipase member K-like [Zophobas morio]